MSDKIVPPWESQTLSAPDTVHPQSNKDESAHDEPGFEARANAFLDERLGQDPPGAEDDPQVESAAHPGTLSPGLEEDPEPPPAAAELAKTRVEQLNQLRELRRESLDDGGPPTPGTLGGLESLPEAAPSVTVIPPINNWIPIGPAGTAFGQGGTLPTVSGRVAGIAITPGSQRVYIASANGGVWRTTDRGETWTSLMDAFDLNPEANQSDSLSCGAIAVVPGANASSDRIYVGSGEGASGAYFGVGPIVSFDGGRNWLTEPTTGHDLIGSAFYQLAIDSGDSDVVFGATRRGLYRRMSLGGGRHGIWHNISTSQNLDGSYTSVVIQPGSPRAFAARRYDQVYEVNGSSMTPLGTNFPDSEVNRIGLAMHPQNPDILYALISNFFDHLHGLYRLDLNDNEWRKIEGVPETLFGPNLNRRGQGGYDLAVAVSPQDENHVVVGGSIVYAGDWSASLYRCQIDPNALQARSEYIGRSVHADVHSIVFAPGSGDELWVGCDGGVFMATDARDGQEDIFTARNTGLQTMTMNHLGQHPTRPEILFCGTQDNGGQRYTGEPSWIYSTGGDSGFFVINWADPNVVIDTYVYGSLRKSMVGGHRYSGERRMIPMVRGDRSLFYAPLVGTPYNPDRPEEAERIAFGGSRLWLSDDFGDSWASIPSQGTGDRFPNSDVAKSIVFADYNKIFVGTNSGRVYQFVKRDGARRWEMTDLKFHNHDGGGGRVVTDIAVDPADASGDSIYITIGGPTRSGQTARVYHYDGRRWEGRGGRSADPSQQLLVGVHHKAIAVDPDYPDHLYVGTDIGAWRSLDGGTTWQLFSNGLPDAAVMDLKLHAPSRMLRVSTHGRGVYELHLDEAERGVELFLRNTQAEYPDFDRPITPGPPDVRLASFYFEPTQLDDFVEFAKHYSQTWLPSHEEYRIHNRIFVQVRNRGRFPADKVRIVALLARLFDEEALPPLPRGYDVAVRRGQPISSASWKTIGIQEVDGVKAGCPKIAIFDFPSDLYPAEQDYDPNDPMVYSSKYAVVVLIHHDDDPYTAPDAGTVLDEQQRKAAVVRIYRYFMPTINLIPPYVPREEQPFGDLFKGKHTVAAGQSLAEIAALFYTAEEMAAAIFEVNRDIIGSDPDSLAPGIELRIPASLQVVLDGGWQQLDQKPRYLAQHTVIPGNTLAGIANKYYGSSVREKWMLIYEENRDVIGDNPSLIRPGQILNIPFD